MNVKSVRFVVAGAIAAVIALAGSTGLVSGAKSQMKDVKRNADVVSDLVAAGPDFENYLLVGSDSREGIDPTASDFDVIGSAQDVGGQRSDTIMVMHFDKRLGTLAITSFPRDLWVTIGNGDKHNKINSAYNLGAGMLARTVTANFGIPINHYLEINFQGFKDLVDAIDGVTLCATHEARDRHIGLNVWKGCHKLRGIGALRYARSRHYEEKINGKWQLEGTGDIGRSARQRAFITLMLKQAVKYAAANPFKAGEIIHAITSTITVDSNLDMPSFLKQMKPAVDGQIANFGLDVYQDTEGGYAVVKLGGNSKAVLDYFAGIAPALAPTAGSVG